MSAPSTPESPRADLSSLTPSLPQGQPFTAEQKQYLEGLFAGIAQRQLYPYVGELQNGAPGTLTADPSQGGPNLAAPAEENIHGTPLSEVCKQELWKHELHGLDSWDKLLEHAQKGQFPDDANNFRFRYHGLFYVAPAQNAFMLRCRIPAGEITSAQWRGLAEISDDWGHGKIAITTRSNVQIREIKPEHAVLVLNKLVTLGLTARGSGADNIRNVTASPTAGIDPQEFLDTRPYAHALHHYILNSRDLYDLPRKFNVSFEGGGAVDTVADTNDIGFMAVRVTEPREGRSIQDGSTLKIEPGTYFRVELAGITGHKQFARDSGIIVQPAQAIAVAAAMLRVFSQNGDRTDRKKARLKYLIDRWGHDRFLEETQKKLSFPLLKLAPEACIPRPPSLRHGHVGVYRQSQKGLNYVGVVIPVGILTTKQARRIAELAENYGNGQIRLTPWQNLLIPNVPDAFVETLKRQLVRMGLHHESTNIMGGLVACTGNQGCKWSSTDTKGQAVTLARHLNQKLQLDQPINIHLTGCPNSCAQHYMGDIGMQGVKVNLNGESVEGYNIAFGGGYGHEQGVAQQVFTGIPFSAIPELLEKVLRIYLAQRQERESFASFTRRHSIKQLQELFSE